jgi:hypothetical protein
MKPVFTLCLALCLISTSSSLQPQDQEAKQASLEIIASLSDHIAELIITNNEITDPRVKKAHYISIITSMADVIATLIIKIKQRRAMRGIEHSDEVNLDLIIEKIAEQLARLDKQNIPCQP